MKTKTPSRFSRIGLPCLNRPEPIARREPAVPLLDIGASQMDIQLGGALSGMTQDLLEDGGGAT
jgi:hypothetical protein